MNEIFKKLKPQKVLVVGDFLLDTYTIGSCKRISPEAPVPVVHVEEIKEAAGGAGNVVLNLVSLGAEVVAVGRIGNDSAGDKLYQTLKGENVTISSLLKEEGYATPTKNRIIAQNQQIVRVDQECLNPIHPQTEKSLLNSLESLLSGVRVVAISDYGKGFLSDVILESLIQMASQRKIPVIVDPKGSDYCKYRGATILKPNLAETYAAARLSTKDPLTKAVNTLFEEADPKMLLVTQSEKGMSLFYPDGQEKQFLAKTREVRDVTGAGDTVLAMLAFALANHLPLEEAIHLSNLAGGAAIEHFGCARLTLEELVHCPNV